MTFNRIGLPRPVAMQLGETGLAHSSLRSSLHSRMIAGAIGVALQPRQHRSLAATQMDQRQLRIDCQTEISAFCFLIAFLDVFICSCLVSN